MINETNITQIHILNDSGCNQILDAEIINTNTNTNTIEIYPFPLLTPYIPTNYIICYSDVDVESNQTSHVKQSMCYYPSLYHLSRYIKYCTCCTLCGFLISFILLVSFFASRL
jgi:hypothetical protein